MSQLNLQLAGFILILRVFNQACTMVDMRETHSQINRRLHISTRVTSTPLRRDSPTCGNRETWREGNVAIQQTKLSFPLYTYGAIHIHERLTPSAPTQLCVFSLYMPAYKVFSCSLHTWIFTLALRARRRYSECFSEEEKIHRKNI